jgi:hypothetical protein
MPSVERVAHKVLEQSNRQAQLGKIAGGLIVDQVLWVGATGVQLVPR